MSFTGRIQEMGFVPRALVPVPAGRLQVHLYPTVDSSMPLRSYYAARTYYKKLSRVILCF